MTTQIMFKIDTKTKKAVQKRAKEQGIAMSDFFQSAARDFATGKVSVGIRTEGKIWQRKAKTNFFKAYSPTDAIYDSI